MTDMETFEIDLNPEMFSFDIDAAFQDAMSDVISDEELLLDEKVSRMEVIVTEASSDLYNLFVDFQAMALQIELMCNHDHTLANEVYQNETLSSLFDTHDDHDHNHHHNHNSHASTTAESASSSVSSKDSKAGKKSSKKVSDFWISFFAIKNRPKSADKKSFKFFSFSS